MTTTLHDWIEAYAMSVGQPVPDAETIERILDLAGTAAHASVRQAAPVTCWLAAAAGLTPAQAQDHGERVAATLDDPS